MLVSPVPNSPIPFLPSPFPSHISYSQTSHPFSLLSISQQYSQYQRALDTRPKNLPACKSLGGFSRELFGRSDPTCCFTDPPHRSSSTNNSTFNKHKVSHIRMHGQYMSLFDSLQFHPNSNNGFLNQPSEDILSQSLQHLSHSHLHRRFKRSPISVSLSIPPPLPPSASTPAIAVSRQCAAQYTAHCTVHCTVHSTLHSAQCTVWIVWLWAVGSREWCCDVWIRLDMQTRLLQKALQCSIRPLPSRLILLLHSGSSVDFSELLAKAAFVRLPSLQSSSPTFDQKNFSVTF